MPAHVFTYGSLMFEAVWQQVTRSRPSSEAVTLPGYRRHALQGVRYPAIVPASGHAVVGRLWLAVPDDDLARLDAFEASDYRRETVQVWPLLSGGEAWSAQAYVWRDPARLLERDWDPQEFERDHLAAFVRSHAPDAGQGAGG